MNKILIFACCIIFAIPVYAQENWRENCEDVNRLAQEIIKARNAGVSMSEMMKVADGNKLIETMVIDAYDTPRYNTEEYQARTIKEFRDKWYLQCFKAMRE